MAYVEGLLIWAKYLWIGQVIAVLREYASVMEVLLGPPFKEMLSNPRNAKKAAKYKHEENGLLGQFKALSTEPANKNVSDAC